MLILLILLFQIALESPDIRLKNLKQIPSSSTAAYPMTSLPSAIRAQQSSKSSERSVPEQNAEEADGLVGQLCVCPNGRLFVAAGSESCAGEADDACS